MKCVTLGGGYLNYVRDDLDAVKTISNKSGSTPKDILEPILRASKTLKNILCVALKLS